MIAATTTMAALMPLAAALLPTAPVVRDGLVLGGLLPSAPAARRAAAFEAAATDEAFLPPLLDLLALADTREEWFRILDAIGRIRGEGVRDVERPWRTLQTELARGDAAPPMPHGYAAFKGALLAERVDAEFARLLPHGVAFDGRLDQLCFGGVGPRGIPALTDPRLVAAADASHVADDAPVVGIVLGGEARAYPLQIIDWHEMVNDVLGGTPVALTWCTLCNAAIAYRATSPSGARIVFGSSGLLLRSNKVMFDEATGSLWSQLEGRRLTRRELGAEPLERLPARTTTWGRWRAEHPSTLVLSADTGHERDYAVGAAYGEMFTSAVTMFPVAGPRKDLGLAVKDAVVVIGGEVTIAADRVTEGRPLHVEGRFVVIGAGRLTAARRHVVVDARAWRSGGHTFRREGAGLVDERGAAWAVTPAALVSETGERLGRVPSHVAFAFAAPLAAESR